MPAVIPFRESHLPIQSDIAYSQEGRLEDQRDRLEELQGEEIIRGQMSKAVDLLGIILTLVQL